MEHFFSNIEQTLSEKVKMRVVSQRNNFYQFFKNRYIEFLPSIISYEGLNDENVIIDPIQLEIWLRQGYGVAIGQTKKGTMVLGTVNQSNTLSNIQTYGTRPLTGDDINFFISDNIKEQFYKEITYHDGYDTGNFVVLWNKPLQLTNDLYNRLNLWTGYYKYLSKDTDTLYIWILTHCKMTTNSDSLQNGYFRIVSKSLEMNISASKYITSYYNKSEFCFDCMFFYSKLQG